MLLTVSLRYTCRQAVLLSLSLFSQRLESEKESLERDLSFKADQAEQYDRLLEALRENNRQLQVGVCV